MRSPKKAARRVLVVTLLTSVGVVTSGAVAIASDVCPGPDSLCTYVDDVWSQINKVSPT